MSRHASTCHCMGMLANRPCTRAANDSLAHPSTRFHDLSLPAAACYCLSLLAVCYLCSLCPPPAQPSTALVSFYFLSRQRETACHARAATYLALPVTLCHRPPSPTTFRHCLLLHPFSVDCHGLSLPANSLSNASQCHPMPANASQCLLVPDNAHYAMAYCFVIFHCFY